MPSSPLPTVFWKHIRLGDWMEAYESFGLQLAQATPKATGESARRALLEGGAAAGFEVKFRTVWQMALWGSETKPALAARVRRDLVAFADAVQLKIGEQRRGHLAFCPDVIGGRTTTTEAITGSGPETITMDADVGIDEFTPVLIIDLADNTKHAIAHPLGSSGADVNFLDIGVAFDSGAAVYILDWYLPWAYPTAAPAYQRDDAAGDGSGVVSWQFESADDPVDLFATFAGWPIP